MLIINNGHLSKFTTNCINKIVNPEHKQFIKNNIEQYIFETQSIINNKFQFISYNGGIPFVYDIDNNGNAYKKNITKSDLNLNIVFFKPSKALIDNLIEVCKWLNNNKQYDVTFVPSISDLLKNIKKEKYSTRSVRTVIYN